VVEFFLKAERFIHQLAQDELVRRSFPDFRQWCLRRQMTMIDRAHKFERFCLQSRLLENRDDLLAKTELTKLVRR
jgi:hypothetical protein